MASAKTQKLQTKLYPWPCYFGRICVWLLLQNCPPLHIFRLLYQRVLTLVNILFLFALATSISISVTCLCFRKINKEHVWLTSHTCRLFTNCFCLFYINWSVLLFINIILYLFLFLSLFSINLFLRTWEQKLLSYHIFITFNFVYNLSVLIMQRSLKKIG